MEKGLESWLDERVPEDTEIPAVLAEHIQLLDWDALAPEEKTLYLALLIEGYQRGR